MSYVIYLKKSAEKELDQLPADIHEKIIRRIVSLEENPRPPGVKKLLGRQGYRIRVGDYRVLYVINEEKRKVEIVSVAHRKDVYR